MFHLIFYLREFFRNLVKGPILGIGFIITTICLVNALMFRTTIQDMISSQVVYDRSGGHFHALITADQNHARVARQLRGLPGIVRVEELSEQSIAQEIDNIFGSLNMGDAQDVLANMQLRYAGLKVVLTQELESRSVDLIRDYMRRLIGSENLTIGPVMQTRQEGEQNLESFAEFSQWGSWVVIAILFLSWLGFTHFFGNKIRRHAYLLEQFQRRERVAFKMFLTGLVFTVGGASVIGIAFGGAEYLLLAGFIAIAICYSLILIRHYDWAESFS